MLDDYQVILVAAGDEGGGLLRSYVSMSCIWRESGAHVVPVLMSQGSVSRALEANGFGCLQMGGPGPGSMNAARLEDLRRYVGWARMGRLPIDLRPSLSAASRSVVVVRSIAAWTLASRIGRILGVRPIWYAGGVPAEDRRLRRLVKAASVRYLNLVVVANSRSTASRLRSTHEKVGHIYVPTPDSPELYSAKSPNLRSQSPIRAVMLSRCDPSKGMLEMVDAIRHTNLPAASLTLDIYGVEMTSNYGQQLAREVESANGSVGLHGFTDDPNRVIVNSDIVIAGHKKFEAFGQTVALAFKAGRPVVAVGDGGPAELVTASGGGWTCAAWERRDLVEVMQRVVSSRGEFARVGLRGRKFAAEQLSSASFARSCMELFDNVCE